MKRGILYTAWALVVAVVLAGCISPLEERRRLGDPAPIENAPQAATVAEGEGLDLVAEPLKKTTELGEPVYLALRVRNTGNEPVTLAGNLRPGEGFVDIVAQGPDGRRVMLAPLSESDFENSTSLAPGATAGNVAPVFFGASGWYFTEPGDYQIHAVLKVPGPGGYSAFRSEAAVLTVKASEAGRALFEAEGTARTEAGKFLLWRSGDHLENGLAHLNGVADRYPDAALSSYIKSARVNSLSEPFANYTTGEVRPADCRRASRLRAMVDLETLAANLRLEDALSRAKCAAASEDWDQARTAVEDAEKLAAQRPEFAHYERTIQEMLKHLESVL